MLIFVAKQCRAGNRQNTSMKGIIKPISPLSDQEHNEQLLLSFDDSDIFLSLKLAQKNSILNSGMNIPVFKHHVQPVTVDEAKCRRVRFSDEQGCSPQLYRNLQQLSKAISCLLACSISTTFTLQVADYRNGPMHQKNQEILCANKGMIDLDMS